MSVMRVVTVSHDNLYKIGNHIIDELPSNCKFNYIYLSYHIDEYTKDIIRSADVIFCTQSVYDNIVDNIMDPKDKYKVIPIMCPSTIVNICYQYLKYEKSLKEILFDLSHKFLMIASECPTE